MGLFSRKPKVEQGSSSGAEVPVEKTVTRVTYEDRNGWVRQHDIVLPTKDTNRFNVHHSVADLVDGDARIIRMEDIGREY